MTKFGLFRSTKLFKSTLVEKKKALTGMEGLESWSSSVESLAFASASTSEHETASFQSSVGYDETQRTTAEGPKWRVLVVENETCWILQCAGGGRGRKV